MSENRHNDTKVSFPSNVRTGKRYAVVDLSKTELTQMVIGALPIALVVIITFLITQNMFLLIGMVVGGCVADVAICKKVDNVSMVDYIKNLIDYIKSQRMYVYRRENHWWSK